jgi:hypothetical protein
VPMTSCLKLKEEWISWLVNTPWMSKKHIRTWWSTRRG